MEFSKKYHGQKLFKKKKALLLKKKTHNLQKKKLEEEEPDSEDTRSDSGSDTDEWSSFQSEVTKGG